MDMDTRMHTVLGSISPTDAGITLMHEHVFLDAVPGWWQEPTNLKDKEIANYPVKMDVLGYLHHNPLGIKSNLTLDDPDIARQELMFYQRAGGSILVELSIIGLSDNRIAKLVDVSKQTGIHIVAGTGFYLDSAVPLPYREWPVDKLTAHMVNELKVGIEESRIQAGIIGEVGTSNPVTPFEERSLIASAHAQKETGACITVHIAPDGKEGIKVLQILKDAGADLTRVIMDHMDERLDLDYHRAIADAGAILEYDTFGAEWYYSTVDIAEPRDTDRMNGVVQLIKEGYLGDRKSVV